VIGQWGAEVQFVVQPAGEDQWGIALRSSGSTSLRQDRPARIDLFNEKVGKMGTDTNLPE